MSPFTLDLTHITTVDRLNQEDEVVKPPTEEELAPGKLARVARHYVYSSAYAVPGSRPDLAVAVGEMEALVHKWSLLGDRMLFRCMHYVWMTVHLALVGLVSCRCVPCGVRRSMRRSAH